MALNKVALGHAPLSKEAGSAVRQQQKPCTPQATTTVVLKPEHAATSPCIRQPTAETASQIEQHAVSPCPSEQPAMTCQSRSASMPPRAPERPQTAPLKAAERSPTARPWTAHSVQHNQGACVQRNQSACQVEELGRTRARPGSGGSPTASCAPMLIEAAAGSRPP